MLLLAIGEVDPELVREAREMGAGRGRTVRRALTAALAAVLALAMAVTAYGYFSGADWFKSWFADKAGGLTASQEAYIEANAVEIGQSATVNGWTVTVRSAIADQYDFCILLRVDPPAGTKLDADGDIHLQELSLDRADGVDKGAATGGMNGIICSEAEGGGLTCLWTRSVSVPQDSNFSFLDGAERTLRLERLCIGPDEVAEGPWEIALTLPTSGAKAVELVTEPVPCQGEIFTALDQAAGRRPLDMTVTSFRITALGVEARAGYHMADREPGEVITLPVSLVLTDGTEIQVNGMGGAYGGGMAWFHFPFSAPVVLEDVDHIRLGGDVTIPMPD